jgi:riboflavin kinase/FMN adenylyltransferase
MEVLHFPDDPRPPWLVHPVLALGNFDGLHRGHLKIIERVRRGAAEHGGIPMAMTFDPHPPRVVRPDKAPPLLMTKEQRLEALARAGIRAVAVVRFTHELSQWDPEMFVRVVLVEWLHVSEVWVGANFLFGHDRAGNYTSLRTLGQRFGFRAEKIDPVRYKEFVVSSTRIRRLIGEARMDEAAALLGHHYYLDGTVVAGQRRGREIGFPTANLETTNELVPPHGVYATTLEIDGILHAAMTNIGTRPTFADGTAATIETHVLGFDGELYGRQVRLAFVQRLRDERRFDDVDGLKTQIEADKRRAQRLFTRLSV